MNIIISRRNFLFGASAFSLAGCVGTPELLSGRPKLKFGVVSDIHITDWTSADILRKTFRYFRDQRVDAVMIAGDMADHGLLVQLQNVAGAWYDVFPDDRGIDGGKVEKLFIYGNHDPEGLHYRDAAMDKAFAVHHLSYEEAEKQTLSAFGLARAWDRCFHEEYQPIYTKNVKGYDFIGGHWDPANGSAWGKGPAVDEWFARNGSRIDTTKPFFYFQHPHPKGTVYAADTWGEDAGASTRLFADYANAVAFSGHSHRPITDGRAYWREEFTSIGTGTLSYLCLPGNHQGGKDYRVNLDGRCGQIVNVFEDRLVIERRDFFNDETLDEAVVLEMPAKASAFSTRAISLREKPAFAADAKIEVAKTGDSVSFSFPGAFANATARPFDYRVELRTIQTGRKEWQSWSLKDLYFQPEAVMSRKRAIAAGNVKGSFGCKDMPKDVESFRIVVVPRNSYGGEGEAISSAECRT